MEKSILIPYDKYLRLMDSTDKIITGETDKAADTASTSEKNGLVITDKEVVRTASDTTTEKEEQHMASDPIRKNIVGKKERKPIKKIKPKIMGPPGKRDGKLAKKVIKSKAKTSDIFKQWISF